MCIGLAGFEMRLFEIIIVFGQLTIKQSGIEKCGIKHQIDFRCVYMLYDVF